MKYHFLSTKSTEKKMRKLMQGAAAAFSDIFRKSGVKDQFKEMALETI